MGRGTNWYRDAFDYFTPLFRKIGIAFRAAQPL